MVDGFHIPTYVEIYTCGWPKLARRAGLRYQIDAGNGYPGIRGVFRGYRLSMTCRGLPKTLSTLLELSVANPEFVVLSLRPCHLGDTIWRRVGLPAELTGDSVFDRYYAVFSRPEGHARQVLHRSSLRKQILGLDVSVRLSVRGSRLQVKPGLGGGFTPGTLDLFAAAINIARAVDEL
jgi:hypothetical protein